jgi:hypothetical protein
MNEDSRKHNKDNVYGIKYVPESQFTSVIKKRVNVVPRVRPNTNQQYYANISYLSVLNSFGQSRLDQCAKSTNRFDVASVTPDGIARYNMESGALILISNYFMKGAIIPDKLTKTLLYTIREMDILYESKWKNGNISGDDSVLKFPVSKFVNAMSLNPNNTEGSRRYFGDILRNALEFLMCVRIDMLKRIHRKNKKKPHEPYYDQINMVERVTIARGSVEIKLTETFINYFVEDYAKIQFPDVGLTLSNLASQLLHKICEQRKRSGEWKSGIFTTDKRLRFKVETLIRSAGDIPLYETLKRKRLKTKIVEPFKRAMDEIRETDGTGVNSWRYCKKDGTSASAEDLRKYKVYKNLFVTVEFNDNNQDTQAHKTTETNVLGQKTFKKLE